MKGIAVYWFDDTGKDQCRVPKIARLLRKTDNGREPVTGPGVLGTAPNHWNEATFAPLETTALRLEAELQSGFSGGGME